MKRRIPLDLCIICSSFLHFKIAINKCHIANVILPLKCEFSTRFKKWSTSYIQEQLELGALETKLDLNTGTLHNLVYNWLFKAWKVICGCFDMINKGMGKTWLLKTFERTFQVSPMEVNAKCSFFENMAFDTIRNEELIEDEDNIDMEGFLMLRLWTWWPNALIVFESMRSSFLHIVWSTNFVYNAYCFLFLFCILNYIIYTYIILDIFQNSITLGKMIL